MKLRILATSDIHGSVYPFRYSDNKELNRGFLKLKNTMKKYEEGTYLLIDNGDILEGNPFLTYYYTFDNSRPHPMAKLIKNNHYNYFNIGNHDLNYGQKVLTDFLEDIETPCITGNLFYKGKRLGNEYTLHKVDETHTIAIIGVLTHYITHWEKAENLVDIEVSDAYEYVKDTVKKIKEEENVQGIMVVYHGGFEADPVSGEPGNRDTGENQAYKMCSINGVDVLISGHQHKSLVGVSQGVHFVQPTSDCAEFGLIDWDLDTHEITQELVPCEDVSYSLEDEKDFKGIEEKTQVWLDTVIAENEGIDMTYKEEKVFTYKHPIIELFNTVEKEACHTDLAGSALAGGTRGFSKEITIRDVLSAYPFPNSLMSFEVDGKFIKEYLEQAAKYYTIRDNEIGVSKEYGYPRSWHFNYDIISGLDYTVKVSNNPGQRIVSLTYPDGSKVKEDDKFTLTVNNYRGAGGGEYDMFKDARLIGVLDKEVSSLIIEYLQKHPKLNLAYKNNLTVIK